MAAKNVTVTFDESLVERIKAYKGRLNVSATAAEAISRELDRLEAEDREAAKRETPELIDLYIDRAPVVVMAELERAEGRIPPPAEVYREIGRRAAGRPAYFEAALETWNAGTVEAWRRRRNPGDESGYTGGSVSPYSQS